MKCSLPDHLKKGSPTLTFKARLLQLLGLVPFGFALLTLGTFMLFPQVVLTSLRQDPPLWQRLIDAPVLAGSELVGTFAFATFGCVIALKNNHKWPICIISGLFLTSWGGGFRDVVYLQTMPWFVRDMHLMVAVLVYCIAFTKLYQVYRQHPLVHQYQTGLDYTLVLADSVGLLSFAVIGILVMRAQTEALWLLFLSGLTTQLGGGIFSSILRRCFRKTVRTTWTYYLSAALINLWALLLLGRGVTPELTTWMLLLPTLMLVALQKYRADCRSLTSPN